MLWNEKIFVLLLAGVLAVYIPFIQTGYICEAAAASSAAGKNKAAASFDEQTEYTITIKKEGKELILQKNAEVEIIQIMEAALGEVPVLCNCVLPWDRVRLFEENGIVITVKYPAGKELTVADISTCYPCTVNSLTVMAAGSDIYMACNGGGRRYLSVETYEKICLCLTSEYIVSAEPIDYTAPKTNIKNGKTYKPGKKITFSDKGSGMKYAKMDGKKIKSGHIVRKKGKHKLVLMDKAGNKRTVKFTIK